MVRKGKLKNCLLVPGAKGPMFYQRKDGTIVANLDGYAIVPRAEYERLALADERALLDKIPEAKLLKRPDVDTVNASEKHAPIERALYTVKEFIERNAMSRRRFYVLANQGKLWFVKDGRKTLIPIACERAWHEQLERTYVSTHVSGRRNGAHEDTPVHKARR